MFGNVILTGISGGEFGVHGRMQAYDIKTGKLLWKAYSTGPDDQLLFDPDKTMTWTNGKMARWGKDSSLKTWKGRSVENRRRHHLGLVCLRSELEPGVLRIGQPQHLESQPAAGRQQVVDDHFARDLNTGMAKWVYQMTPHDQWDYDG